MEPVTIISNHVAQNFVLEYRRNAGITEQEPAVEKRRIRLHMRFIKFLEVSPTCTPELSGETQQFWQSFNHHVYLSHSQQS